MINANPLAINLGQFPQDEAATARASALIGDTTKNLYGVYSYYDRYQSRPFIGRRQWTLATGGVHPCIRFTDAAVLYFWPYRRRPNRGPIDTDFNLGIRRAQADLDNCPWLLGHLVELENKLVAAGELNRDHKRKPAVVTFSRADTLVEFERFKLWSAGIVDELWKRGEPAKLHRLTFEDAVKQFGAAFESVDKTFLQ
jgi:hypothetical protein